jgi:hypothetical protein
LSAAIVCAIASVACDRGGARTLTRAPQRGEDLPRRALDALMGMRIAALPRRKRICAVDEAPEIGR